VILPSTPPPRRFRAPDGRSDVEVSPPLCSTASVLVVDDQENARSHGDDLDASVRSRRDGSPRRLDKMTMWRPDVLLADIGLPRMDRYALIKHVRRNEKRVSRLPAAAITAYASDVDPDKVLAAGATSRSRSQRTPSSLRCWRFVQSRRRSRYNDDDRTLPPGDRHHNPFRALTRGWRKDPSQLKEHTAAGVHA
jgi:CheY-like chemotaxis protein